MKQVKDLWWEGGRQAAGTSLEWWSVLGKVLELTATLQTSLGEHGCEESCSQFSYVFFVCLFNLKLQTPL